MRDAKASHKGLKVSLKARCRLSTCRAGIALPQVRTGFGEQRNALDVVRHREDVHDPERKRDPLCSAALARPHEPVTCTDAVSTSGDGGTQLRELANETEPNASPAVTGRRRSQTTAARAN